MAVHLAAIAQRVAREAGALLLGMAHRPRKVAHKGPTDLVTDADTAAEALIFERLHEATPDCAFVGEEGGQREATGTGEVTWIVDPLDGTTNYAMRIPHYAVSIAAVVGNAIVAGAIFDPSRDELFVAAKGSGATLNGRAIYVATATRLEDAVVATGMTAGLTDGDAGFAEACALNLASLGIRKNGAAALDLAWVAAGRFGAYFQDRLSPWDLAAGALLVEEAGGVVSARLGGPFVLSSGEILASNGPLHPRLSRLLSKVSP